MVLPVKPRDNLGAFTFGADATPAIVVAPEDAQRTRADRPAFDLAQQALRGRGPDKVTCPKREGSLVKPLVEKIHTMVIIISHIA